MVTHHAVVEEATESDNTTWVYITCDPGERFVNAVPFSKRWAGVTCKNCLRRGPTGGVKIEAGDAKKVLDRC